MAVLSCPLRYGACSNQFSSLLNDCLKLARALQLWSEAFSQIITALFFLEVMMIALLAIKKSFAAILVGLQILQATVHGQVSRDGPNSHVHTLWGTSLGYSCV